MDKVVPITKYKHFLPTEIVAPERGDKVRIVIVGAGGNGSNTIIGLAQMDHALKALGHPGLAVTAIDDDIVGPENVGRQKFSESDIGRSKAECMITRVNMFFRLRWRAEPVRLDKSHIKTLQDARPDIVIGAVDNVASRKLLSRAVRGHPMYLLDMGNSKDAGQVILGTGTYFKQPQNNGDCLGYLPTIIDLFPRMQKEEKKAYQGPSCSVRAALREQNLFINSAMSTFALHLLWEGFTQGYLTEHGVFINLATKRSNPVPISPAVWQSMGWVPHQGKMLKAA